jgi:hypothetical protein
MTKQKNTPPVPKKETYKMGGHLVDLTLKSTFDTKDTNIFDTLTNPVQKLITTHVSIEFINYKGEGIKLTGSEYRVLDALNYLLHLKSQNNSNPNETDYYYPSFDGFQPMYYFDGTKYIRQQMLYLSLYELTQYYKGNDKISGKDCENLLKILTGLSFNPEKKALIRYVRESKTKKEKLTQRIEEFQSLIKMQHLEQEKESLNTGKKSVHSEIVVHINPVFRDQIETKFVPMPYEIISKMTEAYGNTDIPAFVYKLRNYLAREFSSKRYKAEIAVERLLWITDEYNMKNRQQKRAYNNLCTSIDVMIKIGLLQNHALENNKQGEPKIIFYINEKWLDEDDFINLEKREMDND